MRAIRLHGPADLRVETLPDPAAPGPGQALVRVKAIGVCGSDLHMYQDARIGDTAITSPACLGHEFAGVVEAVGGGALDGFAKPLRPGALVAVDPAQPCGMCEWCEKGNPNLCPSHKFVGVYPDEGAMREKILVPARTSFPVPVGTDAAEAALLEPLGIGLHSVDLGNVHVGDSMAILGAGPIGLMILQVAKLAGAAPIFVTERLPWRLDLAKKLGASVINFETTDPVRAVMDATSGRGVDVAIEAAWADHSVQQAADMTRVGGRLVITGIPGDDRMTMKHSTARRKGLTIRLVRRMKHTYPRAIALHARGAVDLKGPISHRLPLAQAAEAFAMNTRYDDGVVKIVLEA